MLNKIVSFLNTDINDLASKAIEKKEIGSDIVQIHNQHLSQTRFLGSIIESLDAEFFTSSDFIFFLNLKASFVENQDKYQGLNNCAELFALAIKAQSNFLKIEQTELRYRSRKQQEFYDFVFDLLAQKFEEDNSDNLSSGIVTGTRTETKNYSSQELKTLIRNKLTQVQEQIKTEEGKKALDDYCASLEELATKHNLGLKLLYLFKKSATVDFSVLRVISDMVTYLQDKNVTKMKAMEDLVLKNQEIFVEIGRIVGVPKTRENATTYGILLQFIALSYKYQSSLEQFTKMMACLKDWRNSYRNLLELREQYPHNEYTLPEEFTRDVTAVNIYEKYQQYIDWY